MTSIATCNEIFLQTVRIAAGAPGVIARSGAILHLAMFEAVNSLSGTPYDSYLNALTCLPDPNARPELSAIYAAQRVLTQLAQDSHVVAATRQTAVQQTVNLSFQTLFLGIQATAAEHAGSRTYGECLADAVLASRQADGYDQGGVSNGSILPGYWRPTQPNTTGVTPHWGRVRPFSSWPSPHAFRPTLPGGYATMSDLLASPEYAAQVEEVRLLGGANSAGRTDEQTQIAFFWANDLDGTSKPPGQLYSLTATIARQRNLSLVETARLFALVGMAMADAAVVAWDAKYETPIDLWRPETAIHEANADGNVGTVHDPTWQPLSRTAPAQGMTSAPGQPMPANVVTHFSPAFPAYVSGHATFGAAHAAAMRIALGTDNITFIATTEDPNATVRQRSFNSLTAAALENARSRVYLGVHFQWDGDNGFLSGTRVGELVATQLLKPRMPMPMAVPAGQPQTV
ncbi:hypothetical protein GCM10027578_25580 [Spirosoma luteolum]